MAHPKALGALLLLSTTAAANEPIRLQIEAQPISAALREFVEQTGVQVLFPGTDLMDVKQSSAVHDTVSPFAGLARLLSGSGLRPEYVNSHTLAIRYEGAVADGGPTFVRPDEDERQVPEASGGAVPRQVQETGGRDQFAGIPQVLVRGSRSLNADIERTEDDVRPYVVLDRTEIERSAASSVDDLLRNRVTMNYVAQPTDRLPNPNSLIGNSSSIALRGLGEQETLILVDGRRLTGFKSHQTEYQPDLNSIPLSAIERIEVLPATASGIYGGNATGGVINIILRRDYSGIEAKATYGSSFEHGGANREIALAGGTTVGTNATLSFVGNYSDRSPLTRSDRRIVEERLRNVHEDLKARAPGTYYNAANPPLGSTPNISSARVGTTAPNLVLKNGQPLNSPITFVPAGYLGVQSDGGAALVANAGAYNLELANTSQAGGSKSSIAGHPEVASLSATLHNTFGERFEMFIEAAAARNAQYFNSSPLTTFFQVPSTSPANPFRQNIVVSAPLQDMDTTIETISDSKRGLIGASLRLADDWTLALDYSYSTSTTDQTYQRGTFLSSLTTALRNGSVNLVQDPGQYSDPLLNFAIGEFEYSPTKAWFGDAAVRLAGSAFELPAGAAVLSAVLEDQRQHYGAVSIRSNSPQSGAATVTGYTPSSTASDSAYVELRIPLASSASRVPLLRDAELQVAGRYGTYELKASGEITASSANVAQTSRRFDSFDPSIGLRLEPADGLVLRTSFGTGLRPPSVGQLQALLPTPANLTIFRLTDPKRGGEAITTITQLTGGNPNLDPESSDSFSAGLVWSPTLHYLKGFRGSFDWTRIRKKDNITIFPLLTQPILANEDQLPGVITRAPAAAGDPFGVGPIQQFDARFRNGTRAVSESYDLTLRYSMPTDAFGEWTLDLAGTKLIHATQQSTPISLSIDSVGTITAPRWAANAALTWSWRQFAAVWSTRYFDSYWVEQNRTFNVLQNGAKVDSAAYHDLFVEYRFSGASAPLVFAGTAVQLGVKNVFGKDPRFYALGAGYFDPWSDLRTPSYQLSIRKTFGQ